MTEAQFKREFDADFFAAWGDAMGGINALYTPPGGIGIAVEVLVDTDVAQFGDDVAPVSAFATFIGFRREQVEPVAGAVVVVDGVAYTLVQRVAELSDESLSRWGVQHG